MTKCFYVAQAVNKAGAMIDEKVFPDEGAKRMSIAEVRRWARKAFESGCGLAYWHDSYGEIEIDDGLRPGSFKVQVFGPYRYRPA